MRARKTSTPEPLTTLATRIPRGLMRRLRVFCVREDRLVQDFVAEAVRERLKGLPHPLAKSGNP